MFDVVIIGGGPGGYAAAEFAAHHGMSVALVERDRLGGTCLHRGCVPTKAYLHTAQVVREASAYAPEMLAALDRVAMMRHKDEIVDSLAKGIGMVLKTAKVTVLDGHATLLNTQAPFSIQVQHADHSVDTVTASHVLLACGSTPARLPVPGCDNPAVWTSDDLLGLPGTEPFQSLLIVGGGVIGVEMASIYAPLGVAVTIVEAEKRCLPMMDTELGRSVEALLKALSVTLLTDARLQNIQQTSVGFTATYDQNATIAQCSAQRVLLATGRMPVTDGLFADGVTLAMQRRAIAVDAFYQTSRTGVNAIGDVNGLCQLAHAAHAQGVAAVSHMLGIASPINPALTPNCVYTSPELASIGLTQDEAKAQGRAVVIGKALTTQNARTLIEGLGRGFIKLIFDAHTQQLVGAQLFCGRATDLVGELALAIQMGCTATQLAASLRPHPTFEEAITDAVLAARFS